MTWSLMRSLAEAIAALASASEKKVCRALPIFDIPQVESEPMIRPAGVTDHGARKSVALDAGWVG